MLDHTVEFQFFWLEHADRILPIGPCVVVGDRQFSRVKTFGGDRRRHACVATGDAMPSTELPPIGQF